MPVQSNYLVNEQNYTKLVWLFIGDQSQAVSLSLSSTFYIINIIIIPIKDRGSSAESPISNA